MIRTPAYAGALLLALSACVADPAEAPVVVAAVVAAAPVEPAAPEPPAIEQPEPLVVEPLVAEPLVAEPLVAEPPVEAETAAIIETAIAALTRPEPEPEPAIVPAIAEAAPEPDIDDDPGRLMGLAGGALAALLGEPGFTRQDADAQIWQYRGNDCMLDIYLYRDGEGAPHRVTYYEFRGAGASRPCFRALLLAQAD